MHGVNKRKLENKNKNLDERKKVGYNSKNLLKINFPPNSFLLHLNWVSFEEGRRRGECVKGEGKVPRGAFWQSRSLRWPEFTCPLEPGFGTGLLPSVRHRGSKNSDKLQGSKNSDSFWLGSNISDSKKRTMIVLKELTKLWRKSNTTTNVTHMVLKLRDF